MAFWTGEEGGIETISTLSPEQQQLLEQMYGFTAGKIGQGLPSWQGPFVAPLSAYEQMGLSQLGQYLEGLPPIAETGLGAYESALKGMSPEETVDWYKKYIAPEETRILKEEYIPAFKESMVPGGTLRSTGTERGIADIISQFGTGQLSRIGQAIMGERAGARQMIPYLGEMAGIQAGVPQIQAAMQYGALPRLLEQQDLTSKMAEFVRTTPELSPVLDLAMQILGLQTQAAFYRPAEKAGITQLGEALAPIVGYGLGSFMGGPAFGPGGEGFGALFG